VRLERRHAGGAVGASADMIVSSSVSAKACAACSPAAVAAALSADVRTAPTLARKAGVSGLLFDARTRSLDFTELSNTGTREFVHVLSAQGQQLVGLRHDAGAKGFGFKSDIDRELSRLQRVM
jgi:hypothetical protein